MGRRFEIKGERAGILVIDDYGHHPTEIAATIGGAVTSYGKRVFVLFQPHRYSRTQSVLDEFVGARSATIGFVDGLTDGFAARQGNIGSGTMTVRALLYLIAGHEIHHRTLLRDRYLPLVAGGTR